MSARFADLMALSASQTRESAREAQALLESKRAKEEAVRKEREERERKEKEIQIRRVRREMEAQRMKEELERKAEEEKRKREELKLKQEEEQRLALIYGPKANKSNGAGGRANGAARAAPRGKGDDELEPGAMALTREEKRQKKLMADLNKGSSSASRKPTVGGAYGKHGRRLKGGAIDVATSNVFNYAPTASTEHLSARQRVLAHPNILQRLNTVKRDTRTIDEIMRDRQKEREAKVLTNDEAKGYSNWFPTKPKKDPLAAVQKMSSSQPSASSTPTRGLTPIPASSSQPKPATSTSATPLSPNKPSANNSTRPSQRNSPRPEVVNKQPKTKITLFKPQQASTSLLGKGTTKSATPPLVPKSSSQPVRSSTYASTTAARSQSRPRSASGSTKKRALSESLDDDSEFESRSPSPPYKKRAYSTSTKNDLSSQIWQMFGKDRSRYMKADVYSDEEDDMEVDADALRREEMRSARLAKKEDEDAFREEARHEEEKRRRKKEKEMRERRM